MAVEAAKMVPVAYLLFLGLLPLVFGQGSQRHLRFEYKHSFKGPHLVTKQGNVPFWKHFGSEYLVSAFGLRPLFVFE